MDIHSHYHLRQVINACGKMTKLSGAVVLPEIADTVRFLARCGVDGVVAVNTQTDYATFKGDLSATDWGVLAKYTGQFRGGFSGPPIFGRSLDCIA